MSKLQETNELIELNTRIIEMGLNPDNNVILMDIAKSLAIIADEAAGVDHQDQKKGVIVPGWVIERYLLRLKHLNHYKTSGDKYFAGYRDAMDEAIAAAHQEFDSFIGVKNEA